MSQQNTILPLIGLTVVSAEADQYSLTFNLDNGRKVEFFHEPDCCESVYIEDICGDLNDLKGVIVEATVSTENKEDVDYGIGRWTFYRFSTHNGTVTVRWYGTSNGYYSIGVDVAFYDAFNNEVNEKGERIECWDRARY